MTTASVIARHEVSRQSISSFLLYFLVLWIASSCFALLAMTEESMGMMEYALPLSFPCEQCTVSALRGIRESKKIFKWIAALALAMTEMQ
jgi:hypothetical protein